MHSSRPLHALFLLLCAMPAFPLVLPPLDQPSAASQAPAKNSAQVPVIRANTRAVVVDVVVTHGQDEPVTALHKQDFQLLEDGKPQTVDFFEEHTVAPAAATASLPAPAPMPPHVYTNVPAAPPTDSVNVLLLDTLNTPRADQSYVRQQILEYLRKAKPDSRIAIFVLGNKLSLLQGFTDDPAMLRAALDDKKDGFHTDRQDASRSREDDQADKDEIATRAKNLMGKGTSAGIAAMQRSQSDYVEYQADQRTYMTLDALQSLGRYLAGIPGRKNLIWFSSQYPIDFFPHGGEKQPFTNFREFTSEIMKAANTLTLSKVAVYPIHAEGMMNDHWMEADNPGGGGGAQLLQDVMDGARQRTDTISAMEQLAADTGGEAIFNTNDLNGAVNRAIHNGAHYYTLVYTPTNKEMDGQFRRIHIKMTQGKYKLSYRQGYYADEEPSSRRGGKADSSSAATMANANGDHPSTPTPGRDPLSPLMDRGMPSASEVLYGVRVLPTATQPEATAKRAGLNTSLPSPTTRYACDFLLDSKKIRLQPSSGGKHIGAVRLELIGFDHDGNRLNWTSQTVGLNFDAATYAAIQKAGIPAHLELDLPQSQKVYLSTGVYDLEANHAGTLEIPIAAASPAK